MPYAEIAAAPGLRWRTAAASGLVGAVLGATLGWDWSLLFLLPLVPVLVALSVVDWRTRLLPTWLVSRTYVALLVGLVLTALLARDPGGLVGAGWGWLVAGASYFVLWFIYPRGLGYGDVRLSGVLGLALGHLGWAELLTGLYSGFLLGGVGGGLLALVGVADRKGVPFGPFMVLGALVGRGGRPGGRRASRRGRSLIGRRPPRERLPPCCDGSLRASPTDPPWSRSSRAFPPTSR